MYSTQAGTRDQCVHTMLPLQRICHFATMQNHNPRLYGVVAAVVVLIHRLEPARIIVRVAHDVDVPGVAVLSAGEHGLTSAAADALSGRGEGG